MQFEIDATPLEKLQPMLDGIVPISKTERRNRILRAQVLMRESDVRALILDATSTLFYFTGIRWSMSERISSALISADGEVSYVCPAFEADRLKEMIIFGETIETWEEDEDPCEVLSVLMKKKGITGGKVGLDGGARFFFSEGLKAAAGFIDFISAEAIISACRIIKSKPEISLLKRANDITTEAFKTSISSLREGMTQAEFREISTWAHKALGVDGVISVQFGASTALPHGSSRPVRLKEGDVVLMDGGCRVEGYTSDISRTIVFGTPTARQLEIWELERQAQEACFKAVVPGASCESVDAAGRAVIENFGFGPGYSLPGLPHRTGHGIGLDGHEWGNIVPGNKSPLRSGMCFSIEPNISIPGEFGVRLEDCVYMTEGGMKYFSQPCQKIDEPFIT